MTHCSNLLIASTYYSKTTDILIERQSAVCVELERLLFPSVIKRAVRQGHSKESHYQFE